MYIVYIFMHTHIYINIYHLEESRHPGNWLPSLWGLKRCKEAKNEVELSKSIQNQRKNSPHHQGFFGCSRF